MEINWLISINILEEYQHKTLIIDNRKYNVDAFDPITNTIYEFYGDYWHGNPIRFSAHDLNLSTKKSFNELYQKTLDREKVLKQAGYNLITIWENDWNKIKKKVA